MSDSKRVRGTGVRHTLPNIGRFAGLWMGVTVAAVLVASSSTYLALAGGVAADGASRMLEILVVQTSLLVLAVFALGVFTTHRLAGPWIGVQRACDDVARGDLGRVLRLRQSDAHLREVEHAFNQMMASLRERYGEPASSSPAPQPTGEVGGSTQAE